MREIRAMPLQNMPPAHRDRSTNPELLSTQELPQIPHRRRHSFYRANAAFH